MGRKPRLAALWGVLALVAVLTGALAAASVSHHPRPVPVTALPTVTPTPTPAPLVTPTATAAPTPPKPRIPRGTDVRATLRRALLHGRIRRGQFVDWRTTLARATSAARRLSGARGSELRSVLSDVTTLAAAGRLTVSRMPLAFLTLKRNTTVWRFRAFPAAGERMTFGSDPAVFQYFPGHGMQFHALATAGRANALATPCLAAAERARSRAARRAVAAAARRRTGDAGVAATHVRHALPCHPKTLERRLDRLVQLASSRGGFTAWEYPFSFGGGGSYWVSAMTQATAAQALARGAEALGRPDYRAAALSALGAFDVPPPVGVRSGDWYVMYSSNPSLHILNGFLQAVIGLHDVAELTGSAHAERLYARGERTARGAVAAYDTGAWSRYSYAGRESSLSYHELVTGFLSGLCTRTSRAVYCDTAARFTRYEHEPPSVHLAVTRKLRQERGAALSFWVSKVSWVRVTVRDRKATLLRITTQLPRGRYRYAWTPPRAGDVHVTVAATGPEGRTGVARAAVHVKAKPKPKKHKPKKKPKKTEPKPVDEAVLTD
jgi:hypothetical protein